MGAFWLVLGAPWELQVAPENFKNDYGALLGFFLLSSLSFFSLLHPLTASKWFFIFFSGLFFSSWSFSRLILSSQDDPLTLKNIDFSFDIRRILKNQRFRTDLGPQSVLGFSWAPFRCSWGLLGSLLAGLGGSLGAPGGSRKL